jgi:putative exporter of polyketide antibiotics
MKEFAVYTGLRAALFAICFAVLWFALNNWLSIFPLLLIALIISSILSIFVLRAARDRLAGSIEQRAARIAARMEAARRAEDDD